MDEIRVDQSHCNLYLAELLKNNNWNILFKDAGRVSRGGSGTQGQTLRIFESSSFHIPDIVGLKDETLLLIEIDSSYRKSQASIAEYLANTQFLLNSFQQVFGYHLSYLKVGFCKSGITANPDTYFQKMLSAESLVNLWVVFQQARTPVCLWTKTHE